MYQNLINLYSISKTLRFELKPQGKTLENIKEKGIITEDKERSEKYVVVKKLIDSYHKKFIEKTLGNYSISENDLKDYLVSCLDKEVNAKVKEKMRKDISKAFTSNEEYKEIFSEKLITKILPNFLNNTDELETLEAFNKFTTYFTGFFDNRKNIYVAEEKSTSIAYRIVDENLPIYIYNMKSYEYIKEKLSKEAIEEIETKLLHNKYNLDKAFSLEGFNNYLNQSGIEEYNRIIGGVSEENGTKVKGLNEYINEYKQKNPQDKKINKLDILKKQILSDTSTESFVIDKIENDEELLKIIVELVNVVDVQVLSESSELKELFQAIDNYDCGQIYLKNDITLTNISNRLYSDWSTIKNAISSWYDETFGIDVNKETKKYINDKEKYLKNNVYFSMDFLNSCLKSNENYVPVQEYFKSFSPDGINVFETVLNLHNEIQQMLNNKEDLTNLKQNENFIYTVKLYLDALKKLQNFLKVLVGARYNFELEKDNTFYEKAVYYWDELQIITNVYNKIRNYLTSKVYSEEKFKINFENPTLLNGWDLNKERDNKSIILRDKDKYYLLILDKKFKGTLETSADSNECYEKMEYKLLPGPNKMLPKVCLCKSNIELYNPSKELLEKYDKGLHLKGINFDIDFCHELIDFFKHCIALNPDWQIFDFKFTDTKEYKDISQFYKEVELQGYKVRFANVQKNYINELVDNGDAYLFQIYNKDFSEFSKGKPNLHTLYWKALFEKDNLDKPVFKLNGEAEMFYRPASIERKITHPKNQAIKNKNMLNDKKESNFEYDLIKNRRYTEDKFQFHVPITINFGAQGINNINEMVNENVKRNDKNYVIGIDRGERHLLYLVLIDSDGKIVEQYSLNRIINEYNGKEFTTDYHELLEQKEKERANARESWNTIENIKELKEGYLSQVINKITDLMIKYNAIIALEDLNFGFKRGRQKIEKQVYQKFEKMLIDKLNLLAKKDISKEEKGSIYKAYQLANKFESFKKLGKQSGVMYYVPAWNTSKIDPTTGFTNLFYIKYENEEKAKQFFSNMEDMRYNKVEDYFEFCIDYNKFSKNAEGTKTNWTICTYGDRILTFRNKENNNMWDSVEVNLTEEYKKLFDTYSIDYTKNLKNEIQKVTGKAFWEKLVNLFRLTLQMRNSVSGSEKDYIISPIKNNAGEFYDSRKLKEGLPENADANGAYNIALKGLWVVKQIKETPDGKLKNIKLAISNKEWLNFVQERGK